MTSIITAEERTLIDAAIAAGRVQRIPQGVVAIDALQPHSWKEAQRRQRAAIERAQRLNGCKEPQPDELRAMLASGLSYRDIAKRTGMSLGAVYRRCMALGYVKRGRKHDPMEDELRALMAEGLTYRQMSKRVGLALSAVHRRCKKIDAASESQAARV